MNPATTETTAAEPEKETIAPAEKPEGTPAEESGEETSTPEVGTPAEGESAQAAPAEARVGLFNRAAAFLTGKTQLVNQLEAAHKENATLRAQLAAMTDASARVTELEASNQDLQQKLAAAEASQSTLQKEVRAELTSLGVPEKSAPPVIGGEGSGKPELSREEFEKLPHHERNAFMRKGGKLVA